MWIYSIVRTFFNSKDEWQQTVMADSYKVLGDANNAFFGIIISLMDTGVEYIGTFTLDYLESTKNIQEKHATLEYPDGRCEIISIQKNWLN